MEKITIKEAITEIQNFKARGTREGLREYSKLAARGIRSEFGDENYAGDAYRLECIRLKALENQMEQADPAAEEWANYAEEWERCSARAAALWELSHGHGVNEYY